MKRFLTHQVAWATMAFLALICCSIPSHAVGPTGKIVGTVLDPTGAPVSGAKVTITNEGTGEARAGTSDDSGDFTFPILPVGTYSIKVTATGFQGYQQKGIVLDVDQNITVNAHLAVGSNTEVVTVSASEGQTVDLVDATISQVVDQQRVVDLPLNGRDTLQLQYIMPGVSYDNDGVAHGQGQHEGVVVNGNRPGSNYYLFDGVDMTDSYLSVAPVFPAPDALQEFDIQTSNFTAQYGRSSGGLVNAVSRAGTNSFHGGLFEFFRNTVLDTHNYFDVPGEAKPALKLNQYGGDIGGPIRKGKTFFFGYWQGTRQRKDETVTIGTVFTDAENPTKTSDGSAQFPAGTIVDPQTGMPFATDGLIPANRIDPVAFKVVQALMNYTPNNGTGGYTYHAPSADNEDSLNENQYMGRIDQNFGTKDLLFGHYFFNQDLSTGYGAGNMDLPHDKYFRNQNVALDWNHTFTPRLINTAVMGFTRVAHHRGTTASDGWDTFGSMPGQVSAGIPNEFYTSVTGGFNNGGDGTFIQNRQTWQYTDFLSYVRGKHAISVGGDFRKESVNRIEDYYTDPIFNFNGQFSGASGQGAVPALADLLLGLPNYFNLQTEVASDLRHAAMDMYVQDNYKVNKHLTIDAGFRWEPFLPPVDNLNDQICFDPTFKTQSTFYPTAPPGFTFPGPPLGKSSYGKGDQGCPRAMVPNRWKNVAPRLGLNFDPFGNGKTSIRAAYGLFWDQARLIAWNRYSTAQPFDENFELTGLASIPTQGALTGYGVFTANASTGVINPFPFVIPRTPAQRAAFSPSYTINGVPYWPTSAEGTVLPPNFNEGYAGQWNLSIDQELASNWVLTVSYVGNHGTHLFMSRDINWAPISTYDHTVSLAQNQLDENNRRLFAYDGNCGINQTTLQANPCLGQTQEEANLGWSNFDGLEVSVNHRFANGFSLLGSYVWSKYLDIVSYGAEGGLGPRNPLDFRQNYGPSDSDVRHRITSSYIYQLPKLQSAHGIVAGLVNDWQNQGVLIAQTGSPYTIGSYSDTGATGIGGDFADLVPGQSLSSPHRGVKEYFNTAAFTEAADGTYGTSSRGALAGPSRVNMDFSLFKEFPIHEKG
ncbi:MAG: carboxypeptidase regulatory-like domain-containing protein, partial [Terracidiphilus sp.]